MVSTPADWLAGQEVDALAMETEIHDQFADLIAGWTAYTPVWSSTGTQPVIGNGSITGRHKLVGKTCTALFEQVMGTTTTFGTGTYAWSLPFTAANPAGTSAFFAYIGSARGHAASWYHGAAAVTKNTNTAKIFSHNGGSEWSPTVPITWTAVASVYLHGQVTYEIA